MVSNPKSLAILGAGKLGVVLAQLAIKAGYTVYVAGSGSPKKIQLSIQVLASGALVTTSKDAILKADVVILALPLSKYRTVPKEALANKLVIDAMNYWWEVDGDRSDLPGLKTSTSEMVQDYLSKSRVVKAISHIGYHHLFDETKPTGGVGRKAIAIAGDNKDDNRIVAQVIDDIGFDPLIIGDLSKGIILEPGHPAFGAHVGLKELLKLIDTNRIN